MPLYTRPPSYQTRVLRHLRAGKSASLSMPFKRAEGEKKGRFGGLMRVAERLSKEGFLGFSPFFLFPVVSTRGCMNSDMGSATATKTQSLLLPSVSMG